MSVSPPFDRFFWVGVVTLPEERYSERIRSRYFSFFWDFGELVDGSSEGSLPMPRISCCTLRISFWRAEALRKRVVYQLNFRIPLRTSGR